MYPMLHDQRAALRGQLLERAIREARRTRLGASLKCGGYYDLPPSHAGEPGGCANDGSGCLCECHDPGGAQ